MTKPIDLAEFKLLNMKTGETVDLDTLENPNKGRWDIVYSKQLARMLDIIGDEKTRVLAYLLRKKDTYNLVNATLEKMATETGVSRKTVGRVMKIMQQQDFVNKVGNGKWRLSPRIICNGSKAVGMATINYYENEDKK